MEGLKKIDKDILQWFSLVMQYKVLKEYAKAQVEDCADSVNKGESSNKLDLVHQ